MIRWVNSDRRLRACIRRWRLQAGDQLAGGFRSEVTRCVAADGTEVIVKLAATREHARAEAAALTAWARTGAAARLIDADFDHNALLLEQIRPGTHLIWEAVVFRPAVPGVPRGGEIGSFSPLKPGRARRLGV